ncbi:MAG: PilZ domain-containing protein [Candidatus Omnitrophica bacterium]|nr:PilZ domain-containing protein [Candidatus Omnitrophota bacterium]
MSKVYAGPERRRFRRVPVDFIVIYQVNEPLVVKMSIGWDTEVEAMMLDLSEGGMAVLTNYYIPKDTVLSLRFTLVNLSLSDQEKIRMMRIVGNVRYAILIGNNEYRIGICFTEISDSDKKAISDFVKLSPLA